MIITVHNALKSLRPDAEWELADGSYASLIWKDLNQTAPTESEINAEIVRLQTEYDATEYQRLRAREYPPIGDQLDALWKGGAEAEAMLAKVQAVKQKYPKGVA